MFETRTNSGTLCLFGLFWLLTGLVPQPARAGTTGAVEGRIVDVEEERPLAGATVTVSGPLPRSRTAVTGEDGRFRFPGLPPGNYELTVSKPGYTGFEQTRIQVEIEHTVSLLFEAVTAFDENEVMITGSAPVLDVTSSATGSRYDLDFFDLVPLDRTLRDLPSVTPGVVPRFALAGPVSIAGGVPGDHLFRLDGLDVTSPLTGEPGVALPWEHTGQMEVSTGGRDASREGSFGGIVQLVTRRGGAERHGRASLIGQARGLEASTPATVSAGRDLGAARWDAGVALGGSALSERLWFFGAFDRAVANPVTLNRQGERFDSELSTRAWTGRLTGQPGDSHLLALSAFGNPTDVETEPLRDAAGRLAHDGEIGGRGWVASYHGRVTPTLFLELRGGHFEETLEAEPLADRPLYEDLTASTAFAASAGCGPAAPLGPGVAFTPGCVGGSVVRSHGEASRDEVAGVVSWTSGRAVDPEDEEGGGSWLPIEHTLRFGLDARSAEALDDARFPGPSPGPFVDSAGVVVDPAGLSGQRWQILDDTARLLEIEGVGQRQYDETAIFVEDRVRLGEHAVLRIGLRAERVEALPRLGAEGAEGADGENRGPELEFDVLETLSPRLALVWDLQGNGRSRFFAHYGRYTDPRPPLVDGLPFAFRRWNLYTFVLPEDGSLPTADDPGRLLERRSLARTLLIEPGLEPPSLNETRIGFMLEPLPDIIVGFSAVLREVEEIVESVSVDGGETYVALNPGGTLSENPVTGEPLPSLVFFPRPERDYRAFEVRVGKGFSNAWQLGGSYTFAESEGNYGASIPPPDEAVLTPDFDTRFDLPSTLPEGEGLLLGDRRHQWRLYGSWQWASKLTTGVLGRYFSGARVSRLAADPALGRETRFLGPSDDGGRLTALWSLDFHLEVPLEAQGWTVEVVGDVINLTNRDAPVRVVEEWTVQEPEGSGPPQTQPAFGTVIERQQPRTLRLGVRMRW